MFGSLLGIDLSEATLPMGRPINGEAFSSLNDGRPRRICFATTHANALKGSKSPKFPVALNLPFRETIGPLLQEELGVSLFENKFGQGVWHGFENESEAQRLSRWIEANKDIVFIRDLLDLSVSLSAHIDGDHRTEIGELEYEAKWNRSAPAIRRLAELSSAFVNGHSLYGLADLIVPVPPRPGKEFDLPTQVALHLGQILGKPFADSCAWLGPKPQLKEMPVNQKWDALSNIGLDADPDLFREKRVLLIDDLYQSGATINFVAGKIKEAGAKRVFGLTLVKSRRDTDNQ